MVSLMLTTDFERVLPFRDLFNMMKTYFFILTVLKIKAVVTLPQRN